MCLFNFQCKAVDGSCNCHKDKKHQGEIIKPLPIASDEFDPLEFLMAQQGSYLHKIIQQNSCIIQQVVGLVNHLCAPSCSRPVSESITLPSSLLEILVGPNPVFHYQIKQLSEIPSPAYKERAFPLECALTDMNGQEVSLPQPVEFKILLFTSEQPPKMLKTNTSGDKVMRGTPQVESQNFIFFRKIVIKEVSSHFRNGKLFLVVIADQAPYIKPLIIENFVIKARKMNQDQPQKKQRTDN